MCLVGRLSILSEKELPPEQDKIVFQGFRFIKCFKRNYDNGIVLKYPESVG